MNLEHRFITTIIIIIAVLFILWILSGAVQAWWCPGHSGGSFYCTGKG